MAQIKNYSCYQVVPETLTGFDILGQPCENQFETSRTECVYYISKCMYLSQFTYPTSVSPPLGICQPRGKTTKCLFPHTSNQQVKDFYETRPAPGEWISPTALLFPRYRVWPSAQINVPCRWLLAWRYRLLQLKTSGHNITPHYTTCRH